MKRGEILSTLERQARVLDRMAEQRTAVDLKEAHRRAAQQLRFVRSLMRQDTYDDTTGEAWVVAARLTIRAHMERGTGLVHI